MTIMSENEPPVLYEVVVYMLKRINDAGDEVKEEFKALATPGKIRLLDGTTWEYAYVDGLILTKKADFDVGMSPGSLFVVTEYNPPYPVFERINEGTYAVVKGQFVTDVQMIIWNNRY